MKTLIAALSAITLATAPALADGAHGHHNETWHANGWNGGHHHHGHWGGSNWVWGAPLLGAAIAGAVLAAPYAYVPPYTYTYGPYLAPAYPTPRMCPNPYGGWYQC